MTSVIFLSRYSYYVFQQHITTIHQDGTAIAKKPKKATQRLFTVAYKQTKKNIPTDNDRLLFYD